MAFVKPASVIRELNIGEEMMVLDVGAGTGAFAYEAAKLAHAGTVYAVDVQKELLRTLKSEGSHRGLHNIETIWADAELKEGTKLSVGSIDRGILANTLFQIEHKEGLAEELGRVIRKKGRLLVLDWTDSFGGLGPHKDHVYGASKARALFERFQFTFYKEFNAGDHHYGLIFEKK